MLERRQKLVNIIPYFLKKKKNKQTKVFCVIEFDIEPKINRNPLTCHL